jgi:hypothetical protein
MEFEIVKLDIVEKKGALSTPKHEGLFYRVKESTYYSQSSGVFHKKLALTPLKRISCKGCPTCDWIKEMIHEYGVEELIEGKWNSGEIVELKVDGGKYWTDCGYEYDCWLEWIKVEKHVKEEK